MTINIENYTEITTIELLNDYKDNMQLQFKIPPVNIWCDYDMKKTLQ